MRYTSKSVGSIVKRMYHEIGVKPHYCINMDFRVILNEVFRAVA